MGALGHNQQILDQRVEHNKSKGGLYRRKNTTIEIILRTADTRVPAHTPAPANPVDVSVSFAYRYRHNGVLIQNVISFLRPQENTKQSELKQKRTPSVAQVNEADTYYRGNTPLRGGNRSQLCTRQNKSSATTEHPPAARTRFYRYVAIGRVCFDRV